jgi:hypothetical protein
MSVAVLSALAILVSRREALKSGPLWQAAALAALAGLLTGSTVGLKLPEAPFALGFAAALIALGGSWKHQAARLIAGGLGGLVGFLLFAGFWMLKMEHLTGNPLFPYFNEYFHSPLALASPYRDMRFIPTHFWHALGFPYLFAINWAVADDIPFRDIRVMLAYTAIPIATIAWIFARRAKEPLIDPRVAALLFAFAALSYIAWLKIFAIYRYILGLEMLGPILIAAAIGLLPFSRRVQLIVLAGLFFFCLVLARSDYMVRAPLGDPYISTNMPEFPDPDHAMVLMTGDAPLGFLAPEIPHRIPVLRIDGWMVQPRDGTLITRQMRARVAAHKGGFYLISEANDMGRADAALLDYDLAIDWLKCKLFDTNLSGSYEWCPLVRRQ